MSYPLRKEVEKWKNTLLRMASLNAVIMIDSHLLLINNSWRWPMDKMHVQQKKPEASICKKPAKKVRIKFIPKNTDSYTNTFITR